LVETLSYIFGSVAMSVCGGNVFVLALVLLIVISALMFLLKVPMAFAFPAGLMLFFCLSYLDPLFLTLSYITIGITGIVFVIAVFRRLGG
jgi:hypothetical protein